MQISVVCVLTNDYENGFLQAVCEDTNSGDRLSKKHIIEKAMVNHRFFYYMGGGESANPKLQTKPWPAFVS